MAVSTLDQLVAAITNGERSHFFKNGMAQVAAGVWASSWTIPGVPGAGATPSTGAGDAPTRATAGALKFANPAGGKAKYLAMLDLSSTQRCQLALIDRLVHTSGLSGTVTTGQTVNSTALPARDSAGASNGEDVELWLEHYTATGATSRTATVSYTNSAGTAGQSGTATIAATTPAGRMTPVTLAAGDTGVRSVQTVTLSGSTGTAGNFGVTLLRRIAVIDNPQANTGFGKDAFDLGLPQLFTDSCLALMGLFDATTTATIFGEGAFALEV